MATEVYEQLIAATFEARSFWVRSNTILKLPANDGQRASQVELDVIALSLSSPPELFVIECKSTFGSDGLDWNTYAGTNQTRQHRYRVFFDPVLRARIESTLRLTYQLPVNIQVKFCLASAATQRRDYRKIKRHLAQHGLQLLGQSWLRNELRLLANSTGYQNNIAVLAAAMLFHPKRNRYA